MTLPRYIGLVPPMVSPLQGPDALDIPGLERLVEHLITGGSAGLFVLGTTGEGPSLSYRLRRELVERTCRQAAGRAPVLVGITDTALAESLALARHAAECGADAVVAAPPYYLPEAQPELLDWLDDLVPALPLPLMLYNMPALTKVHIDADTVRRAADYPQIIGIKDSSGDLAYFRDILEIRAARPDWSFLCGSEEKLAEATAMGGHGGVCGGGNVFPRLYAAFSQAAERGEAAAIQPLQNQVLRVSAELYGVGRHASRIIKGIKCALSCLGICSDLMAPPFRAFREPERLRIEEGLARLQAEIAALTL